MPNRVNTLSRNSLDSRNVNFAPTDCRERACELHCSVMLDGLLSYLDSARSAVTQTRSRIDESSLCSVQQFTSYPAYLF